MVKIFLGTNSTNFGLSILRKCPCPSCPHWLSPQVNTFLNEVLATQWFIPQDSWATVSVKGNFTNAAPACVKIIPLTITYKLLSVFHPLEESSSKDLRLPTTTGSSKSYSYTAVNWAPAITCSKLLPLGNGIVSTPSLRGVNVLLSTSFSRLKSTTPHE